MRHSVGRRTGLAALVLAAAFGIILSIQPAQAQQTPTATTSRELAPSPARPRHQYSTDVLAGFRFAPIGAGARARLGYRYQLFQKDHILFRDTYLWSHLVADLAPTYALGGVEAFFQPLAVIRFGVSYIAGRHFASFGNVLAFPNPEGDYSPQNRDARKKSGEHYASTGQRLTLSLRLQAQVKQLVVRSQLRARHDRMGLQGADRYIYDTLNDVMMKNRGWMLNSDTDAFWNFRPQSYLGARLSVVQAYFEPSDSLKKEQSIRLGPAMVLALPSLQKRLQSTLQLIFLSQWHLRHRYRTQSAQGQAMPTITVALRSQWMFRQFSR